MTPVQSSKRMFFDNSGDPLENGYVYVGQPNTAPQLAINQKTVTFQDSGGSQFTASQPLRTAGGKIVYNGLPITALVDGEHSLLVLDSNQTQVEYEASITPVSGSSVDLSETIRVGLTLSDVKAFDVSVGDITRSVGRVTALDGLGSDWITISPSGSPGNDVDLIDYDNGLQGQADLSKVYRRENFGTIILDNPVSVVSTTDATSYRSVWTEIDISTPVPTGAASAIIRASVYSVYSTGGVADSLSVIGRARKTGTSPSTSVSTIGRAYSQTNANDTSPVSFVSEFTVSLDTGSAPSFEFYLVVNDPTSGANNTTPDLDISVVGYTYLKE